jgi:hypothetical protein
MKIHMAWFVPSDSRFACDVLCGAINIPVAEAVEVKTHREQPAGANCFPCAEQYRSWALRHKRRRERNAR